MYYCNKNNKTKKLNLIFLKIQTHVALLPLFEKKKKNIQN